MPEHEPEIVLSTSLTRAKRDLSCRFSHGDVDSVIEIPAAVDPRPSLEQERAQAGRVLTSFVSAMTDLAADPPYSNIVLQRHANDGARDVQTSFERDGLFAQIRIPGCISSEVASSSEITAARQATQVVAKALAAS